MIVSDTVFHWFVILMAVGICLGIGIYDAMLLQRVRRRAVRDQTAHDQAFGAVIGILIALIGFAGLFKYYLGL